MRNSLNLLFGLVVIFIGLVFMSVGPVMGCGGTFACGDNVSACWDASGNQCVCGQVGCDTSPTLRCQPPAWGFLDRACGAAGAVCAYGCAVSGCILVDGCFSDTVPTPTADPCGGGPRSFCGFGGGWFCCGSNMTCTGSPPNFGCSPTTASTPTPAPTCTGPDEYGPCSPNGSTAPSSDPNGHYLCSGGCWGWVNTGGGSSATPTPSSGGGGPAPTSTPDPGGGACTVTSPDCGGVACCSPQVCLSAGGPPEWCGDNPWAGGGGGGGCTPNGSAEGAEGCCSGYSSGGVCTDPPSCSGCQSFNGSWCEDNDGLCSGGQVCQGGTCISLTYSISGNVYIDTDGSGTKNGSEVNYTSGGSTIRLSPGSFGTVNGSGTYSFSGNVNGSYSVIFTPPSGYTMSTSGGSNSNPRSVNVSGSNRSNVNFGIVLAIPPAPVCSSGLIPGNATVQPGASTTLTVNSCTNVENPSDGNPPPPITWNPDAGGNSPPPSVNPSTPAPSCGAGICSSTTTWTAPNCPSVTTVYSPQVTVAGPGGTTNYNVSITVPGTYSVGVNVRVVTSAASCLPTDGSAYQDSGGTGATVNIINTSGSYSINQNQVTSTSYDPVTTSGTTFTCLPPSINYQVALQPISGYSIVRTNNNGTQLSPGSSPVSVTNLNSSRTVTFCIAPNDPWFQTTTGDVRFLNFSNPVPSGKHASEESTYPGIFYSSDSNADFGSDGAVAASIKRWVINNEYSYNANTENRNGGMSYDFFKAKALQDGVSVTPLTVPTFDQNQITGTGVYEANGDLTINSYTHTNGRRIVILVNGNVTINTPITVGNNQGLFIIAAKGNITVANSIGTLTYTDTTTHLDGFYTAEGDIIFQSLDNTCETGIPDRRINIGGSLVANSLKPFSTTGLGQIKNQRSLCIDNLSYPSLYVAQRADFITQLTDFYKTSYTKWKEVNP